MNTTLDEVRRLRGQVAARDRELAEMRGLVAAHIEATSGPDTSLERERAAYERGKLDGFPIGWVAAEMASEDAHLAGTAHDAHGQALPLQIPVTREGIQAEIDWANNVEDYGRRQAAWWEREYERTHREPARVRQLRPKDRDAEREAV
jgi:hypothetical protein